MRVSVNKIRLQKVVIDLTTKAAIWYVAGYYLTDKSNILGEFTFTSHPDGPINHFVPVAEVQDLTNKLLVALHNNLEQQILIDYEQEDKPIN